VTGDGRQPWQVGCVLLWCEGVEGREMSEQEKRERAKRRVREERDEAYLLAWYCEVAGDLAGSDWEWERGEQLDEQLCEMDRV
jgi:hypothetical protein